MKAISKHQTNFRKYEKTVVCYNSFDTIEGYTQHFSRRKYPSGNVLIKPTFQSHFFRIHINTTATGEDKPIVIELLKRIPSEDSIARTYISIEDFWQCLYEIVFHFVQFNKKSDIATPMLVGPAWQKFLKDHLYSYDSGANVAGPKPLKKNRRSTKNVTK